MSGLDLLEAAAAWIVWALIPAALAAAAIGYLLSLPVRRQERTRFFLSLLETTSKAGWKPRESLVSLSGTGDAILGPSFHLMTAYISTGYSLARALERVPGFLAPRVAGALTAAEEIGALPTVIPICRRMLAGASSRARAAFHYQLALLLIMNPLLWLVIPFILDRALPVLGEIYAGFGIRPPLPFQWVVRWGALIYIVQLTSSLILGLLALFYVGGPLLRRWAQAGIAPILDAVELRIPWRRKRILRDFSALLTFLLDAGLPESRALALASEGIANRVFLKRAEAARALLAQGAPLAEALGAIDSSRELRWRLQTASKGAQQMTTALHRWHEALEAQAFQQEQAASHGITTALLVLNGFFVALLAIAILSTVSGLHRGILENPR